MKRLLTCGTAALAIAGGGWLLYGQGGAPGQSSFAVDAQEAAAEIDTSQVQEMVLGAEDAPVEVIEYASFTCPHCANFHENVFDQLKADYIDTGEVRFVYREVYFDRPGLWAGMVARCGGEERYFGIADLLYERQEDWARAGEAPEIVAALRRVGKTAGLTDEQLDACLSDAAKAQALYATFEQNAQADEITATPSFVIDGELHSNMPYDEFSAILDERIEAAAAE